MTCVIWVVDVVVVELWESETKIGLSLPRFSDTWVGVADGFQEGRCLCLPTPC